MRLKIRVHRSLCFAAVFLIAACTSPYEVPEFNPGDGVSANFDGIKQLLRKTKINPSEVDVVLIHGMCTHFEGWAYESINSFGEALRGRVVQDRIAKIVVANSSAVVYKQSFDIAEGRVNVSAVVWSPIMYPLKEQLCYDMSKHSSLCQAVRTKVGTYKYNRATLNRLGKDTLMNDCLSDAVAYQGVARTQISAQVQEALLVSITPDHEFISPQQLRVKAAARSVDLVLVTESLGSKVAFDSIETLASGVDRFTNSARKNGAQEQAKFQIAKSNNEAAAATFKRIRRIYMAANQIPILRLSDQMLPVKSDGELSIEERETSIPTQASDPLERLINRFGLARMNAQQKGDENSEPFVVTLTDPNDLLSYSFFGAAVQPRYPVLDVVVSVAKTYFGLLENPYLAHTEYLSRPSVVDLIVNGNSP